MKRLFAFALAAVVFASSPVSVLAAPETMPGGETFDAEFYARNNPDVVAALGTDMAALYEHYVNHGKGEGRKPFADAPAKTSQAVPAGNENFDAGYYARNNPDVAAALGTDETALYNHYINYGRAEGRKPCGTAANTPAPAQQIAVTDQFLKDAVRVHNYYKNIPAEGIDTADAVAKQIADSIMGNAVYTTDLQRVSAAAETVAGYCNSCIYGSDSQKYYRSPFCVFVAGVYTCAGSTRALGRVLDYMGFTWQHTNENQNRHQWCIVTMDGQTGFADVMGGIAGYGAMENGMILPDGRMIFFAE